jgi:Predicted membrane protein
MKRIVIALLAALAIPAMAASAGKANQKLVIEFVDGEELQLVMPDKSQKTLGSGLAEGDEVPAGATLVTGPSTTVELKIKPNGTILKIAKSTSFKVASLAGQVESKNAFGVLAGKVRAVAAKGGQYELSSKSATCAVRGTDFALDVGDGGGAKLMVATGLVQFDKLDDTGAAIASIGVASGQAADALAASFAAIAYSPEQFAETFGDLGFTKLKESDVPARAIEEEQAPEATTAAPSPAPAAAPAPANAAAPETAPAEAAPKEAVPEQAAATAPDSPFMKWLRDSLGFEIGSVTINNNTYSKAVIQPSLALGKAKIGLYLPVIYTANLFDPNDWYKPGGNDEWNFGYQSFAAGDYLAGAADLGRDLALKLKYFEYGAQYRDPFYVKAGNLEGITLGHGLLMRSYANDTEFPSLRRLGFNMGLDVDKGGFELVANDLAAPEIFGGRVFFRPISGFKLGMGMQGIVDWDPAAGNAAIEASDGALKILGAALDLDLPIVQSDILGMRLFADGGATLPYTTATIGSTPAGLQYQLVYDQASGQIKNWGAASGLIGNILFVDYRLEYRYSTGFFRPGIFDATYDRMRSQYAAQYAQYLSDPSSYASLPDIMGVYGEGGFKILNDKLGLTIGYFWPWSPEAGTDLQKQIVASSDELHLRLAIKKGLIPLVDLAGAISYDKRGLAASLAEGSFSLLDADTTFGGEIDLPVPKTPNLDLALIFLTEPERDSSGAIVYRDQAAGIVELKPSISIETRFHF